MYKIFFIYLGLLRIRNNKTHYTYIKNEKIFDLIFDNL